MTAVEFEPEAIEMLDRLIVTHGLPGNTWARVIKSARVLGQFPKAGPRLGAPPSTDRFIVGPWRWMVLVYEYVEAADRVVVFSVLDGRSATPVA